MDYLIAIKSEDGLQKAEEELQCYLKAIGNVFEVEAKSWNFLITLQKKEMQKGSYSVCSDGKNLVISGSGLSEVLCGVYTALEEYGIRFGISGEEICMEADFSKPFKKEIVPLVLYRGIRQHLNFPMDISSYSLNEAKRYVRNLARLRYNSITFHSYPGQFYCGIYAGKRLLAGKFFYGEVQPVSNIAYLKNYVNNLHYYCIEEAETYFNDEEKLSAYAVFWLRSLMEECKAYGMRIVFSFEVRDADDQEIDDMISWIRKAYPAVDVIELATQECGCGWDTSSCMPETQLQELVTSLFGEKTVSDNKQWIDGKDSQMPLTVQEMKKCMEAVRRNQDCRVLIYATSMPTLRLCRNILMGERIRHSFLCAHGAKYVKQNLEELIEKEEWLPAVYSWIEFDGDMFQPQDQNGHNFEMIRLLREKSAGRQIPEVAYNHWRNAENSVSIAYCSQLMLNGSEPDLFFSEVSRICGLQEGDAATLFAAIARAEDFARDELPNIGFCAVYCWYNSDPTYLGYISFYTEEKLSEYRARMEKALRIVSDFCPQNNTGERLCMFWKNRLNAGICHIRVIEALMPLKTLATKENSEAAEEKQAVFARALSLAKNYLRISSRCVVDRSGEGILVSYYKTVFHYIYVLRERFCGIPVPEMYEKRNLDTPPSPMIHSV